MLNVYMHSVWKSICSDTQGWPVIMDVLFWLLPDGSSSKMFQSSSSFMYWYLIKVRSVSQQTDFIPHLLTLRPLDSLELWKSKGCIRSSASFKSLAPEIFPKLQSHFHGRVSPFGTVLPWKAGLAWLAGLMLIEEPDESLHQNAYSYIHAFQFCCCCRSTAGKIILAWF